MKSKLFNFARVGFCSCLPLSFSNEAFASLICSTYRRLSTLSLFWYSF